MDDVEALEARLKELKEAKRKRLQEEIESLERELMEGDARETNLPLRSQKKIKVEKKSVCFSVNAARSEVPRHEEKKAFERPRDLNPRPRQSRGALGHTSICGLANTVGPPEARKRSLSEEDPLEYVDNSFTEAMVESRKSYIVSAAKGGSSISFSRGISGDTGLQNFRRDLIFVSVTNVRALEDRRVEFYSHLRLKERTVTGEQMQAYMQDREFKFLGSIRAIRHQIDLEGDWVTVGVVAGRSEMKKSATGNNFLILKLADLRGEVVNLFLFDECLGVHGAHKVGVVLGILNPKILHSTEKGGPPGLSVAHAEKVLKIGVSLDCTTCRGVKQGLPCHALVDCRKTEFCDFHAFAGFQAARSKRSEFRASDTVISLNDPTHKKTSTGNDKNEANGTYFLPCGQTISTKGTKSIVMEQCKIGSKTTSPELETLLHENSRGARYVRAARGMPMLSQDGTSVFGADAVRKLGFDPTTGKDVITVPEKSPHPSPSKVTRQNSNCGTPGKSPQSTPTKRKSPGLVKHLSPAHRIARMKDDYDDIVLELSDG